MTGLPRSPFDDVIGLRLTVVTADRVEATLTVTPALHQPTGIVHGGVHATVVETLASVGAQTWLQDNGGGTVVGVNNNTNFLRAVRDGDLHAVGLPVHRGRSQQLWNVEIRDDQQRLVARGDVRLANLTPR